MLCPACWIILPHPWGKLVKTQLFGKYHFKGLCENVVFLVLPRICLQKITDSQSILTIKTPCLAMNERARKRYTCFLVRLQGQGSAVSETTKLETYVRMCSHPTSNFCKPRNIWVSSHASNFSTIGQWFLIYGDKLCTCARADAPHP